MRNLLCAAAITGVCSSASAQVGADAPASAAESLAITAIRSVSPEDDAYDDLRPLADFLGDARVVAIGEMTHGDGTAILARTRIIKFLHEEMGFDTVAFESGVIECERVMEALRNGVAPEEASKLGIYPIWSQSAELSPLMQAIQASLATDRPLRLIGFDPQPSSPELGAYVVESLASRLDEESEARLVEIVGRVTDLAIRVDAEQAARDDEWLADLARAAAASRPASDQAAVGIRAIESLRFALRARALRSSAPPFNPHAPHESVLAPGWIRSANVRDRGMADNLLWQIRERLPDSRVIVWAANSHVKTASARASVGDERVRVVPMGEILKEELGSELYTILATCQRGTWAAAAIRTRDGDFIWRSGEHPPAAPGSFAARIGSVIDGNAIVDLARSIAGGAHWMEQPLRLRQDFDDGHALRLLEACDAVLYLESIAPARRSAGEHED